ncbi:MAG: adenylate/guanylate cyclase domain-containing protein [Elusimicrobiota bacterium]|nr:adenylate/guanylate cyclase domain-containing protein [Elusimicrobiota bacterium]
MSQSRKSRFPLYFLLAFTPLFVLFTYPRLLTLNLNGLFFHQEDVWQDFLHRLHQDALPPADPRLIVLAVDEETGKGKGFPLPRDLYAKALDRLKGYGVKTVVFDILFFEKRDPAQDKALADATKRFGKVIHLYQYEHDGTEGGGFVVNEPLPALAAAAEGIGYPNVDSVLDSDGHLRRARLFEDRIADPSKTFMHAPALEIAAAKSFAGLSTRELEERFAPGGRPAILYTNFAKPVDWPRHSVREAKLPEAERKMVYSPYRRLSMLDVLDGTLSDEEKEALKGSMVLIGSTALGYYDHYATPFIHQAPGVEYHANLVDNILNDRFRSLPPVWAIALAVALLTVLPALLLRLSPALGAVAVAVVIAAWFVAGSVAFKSGMRLDVMRPTLGLLLSYLALTIHRVRAEGAEKKMIKSMFGQFVSPEVVEELANDPDKAKLGAQKREMTVFFLDIAHFTTISEKMGPEALIAFLNKYLSALSDVILERRGTIDKYIGDCIMAFWNAPTENKDHAREAILSALGCQRAIDELNKDLDPGLPEIPAIRIGINTGLMNVGFTGTQRKLAYTVLGDEVNLASRLEGANKFFGSKIIASEPAYLGAKDVIEARYLGKARVVGKETPVPVYEPLAEKGKLAPAWVKALPVWEKAVKLFYDKKYEDALPAFEEFLRLMPKDGPGELYLTLARDYAALPPDDWDQVFNLTAK